MSSETAEPPKPGAPPKPANPPKPTEPPRREGDAPGRRPSSLRLVWTWLFVYQINIWRTPVATFFTLAFPLMMFVLLASLISGSVDVEGTEVPLAQFYAVGIGSFAAATATYTNLCIGLSIQRDEGFLKRIRSTPTPSWAYLTGTVASSVLLAFAAFVLMIVVGVAAFDVSLPTATQFPVALAVFFFGTATFAAMGLAMCSVAPSAAAAPALANATILPMAFVSDVFLPVGNAPAWLQIIGDITPLKPFVSMLSKSVNPFLVEAPWEWTEVVVMASWLLGATMVASRFFRWLPPTGGRSLKGPRLRSRLS